jgi:hypothetical protein
VYILQKERVLQSGTLANAGRLERVKNKQQTNMEKQICLQSCRPTKTEIQKIVSLAQKCNNDDDCKIAGSTKHFLQHQGSNSANIWNIFTREYTPTRHLKCC